MVSLTLAVFVISAAVLAAEAGGHGQGSQQGESGMRMARGGWGGQQQQQGGWAGQQQGGSQWQGQNQGRLGNQGRDQQGGSPWQQGANGRQGGSDSRYRTNILDDEDVYGYEAKYPNGEALFVSYRNSDARSRRGPDFARSNSISARMNGGRMGQQGSNGQDWSQQGSQQRRATGNQGHDQW